MRIDSGAAMMYPNKARGIASAIYGKTKNKDHRPGEREDDPCAATGCR
jgi:hypothetical protein